MSKIIINEFYRGTNLTAGDEFIELLLIEDLTAAELGTYFVGDSTNVKTGKYSAFDFTGMEAIAPLFRAGTIISVGGTGRLTQDTSYDPANGDWDVILNLGGTFLPNVGLIPSDIAGDDIVWVDTTSTGDTISADGFAIDIGTATGAFSGAVNVDFGVSTNNRGYALASNLAGASDTANWITGLLTAAMTPGQPNGGINTTYIESLRIPPAAAGIAITQTDGSTTVSEAGGTDTYSIVLSSQPTADVTFAITASAQLNTDTTQLIFTPANWNFPQTVTVSAVNDASVEGNHGGTITHTATSTDANYNGLAIAPINVDITDNDTAGATIIQAGGDTLVTEAGGTDTYSVVLASQPTANVTFTISTDAQINTNVTQIIFTPANWNIAQVVTVSAVDDANVEGNHNGTITHAVTSADANYNGLAIAPIDVDITDNDTTGATIIQAGGDTLVTEAGGADTYSVILTSQPAADVTFTITASVQLNTDTTQLIFTPANWNIAQVVTVSAVDDANIEGNHGGTITHAVTSTDANYNGLAIAPINVDIIDNDTAGATIIQAGGDTLVTEAGGTDTYSVVLTSQPTADVTFTITASAQLNADTTQLIFTPANWNIAQVVIVSAVDDANVEGNHGGTIIHAVTSADGNYNGLAIAPIDVDITDNDAASFTLNKTSITVSESGATDQFTVALLSQPTSDVVLSISSSDNNEAIADPGTLTFTPGNWNLPQVITVTGVQDNLLDNDQARVIDISVLDESSDDAFDNLPDQQITVAIVAISTTPGNDTLNGTAGDDSMAGLPGNDILRGLAGDDRIYGGDGQDTLQGNEGNDFLNGGNGDDVLEGGAGRDILHGRDGSDRLLGGDGNDLIYGGKGADTLEGEAGDDRLYGGNENDVLKGGTGNDQLFGRNGSDRLQGDNGDDLLVGGRGNDRLLGGKDNDQLFGSSGNDRLEGGDGSDRLDGQSGNDILITGNGRDTIVIRRSQGYDRVMDFQNGQDKIELLGIRFEQLTFTQRQEHVLIQLGDVNLIRLDSTSVSLIDRADFV